MNHCHISHPARRGWIVALLSLLVALGLGNPCLYGDTYGYEFRPGPNVPRDFKPGPGVDASGLDLSGSAFIGMDLSNANFERSDLQRTFFAQVRFQKGGASFKGADLRYARFAESPDSPKQEGFGKCDFTDAMIQGLQFVHQYAHLTIEQLRSTKSFKLKDLNGCQIVGGVNERRWYSYYHLEPRPVELDFRQFDLRNATFAAGDFTKSDFRGAIITGATFFKSRITREQIESTTRYIADPHQSVTEGRMYMNPLEMLVPRSGYAGIGFSFMDLSDWDFAHADLRGARFREVNLEGVDFTGADVRDAHFWKSISKEQLLTTKSYQRGSLVGVVFAWLDLSNVDFSYQNLTGAVFVQCDLTDADFTGAVITDADFRACADQPPTIEQVKSTWNYQHGRMEGIKFREELAEALREE